MTTVGIYTGPLGTESQKDEYIEEINMSRGRVFNTYIRGETKEERQVKLKEYEDAADWLAAQEEIGEDGMEHIQCVFGFRNQRYLNSLQKKLPCGENIQITKNSKAMIKYCTDEDKRSGDLFMNGDIPNFVQKKSEEINTMLTACKEFDSYQEAMSHIEATDLAYYICNQKKLSVYFDRHFAKSDNSLYKIDEFLRPAYSIPDKKTLIFVGPTNFGKTQFALAHFEHPLLVRGKQDWIRFKENYTDGIVLDDISFKRWVPETLIHTVERETAVTHDVKYGSVRIPAGVPKIICINDMDAFWPDGIAEYHREAIERRIEVIHISSPLFDRKRKVIIQVQNLLCHQYVYVYLK